MFVLLIDSFGKIFESYGLGYDYILISFYLSSGSDFLFCVRFGSSFEDYFYEDPFVSLCFSDRFFVKGLKIGELFLFD